MLDLLKSRRSIRKYQDKILEKAKIEELLKAGLLAPSSRALRPWEFVAVTDKELLLKLSGCRGGSSSFLAGAPLGIVMLADSELCDVWVEDASIAAIIIQLAAKDMGLGSCWIQVRERNHDEKLTAEDYIKETLNIPEKYSILCILAVGYPGETKEAYAEENLKYHKIHYDKF